MKYRLIKLLAETGINVTQFLQILKFLDGLNTIQQNDLINILSIEDERDDINRKSW